MPHPSPTISQTGAPSPSRTQVLSSLYDRRAPRIWAGMGLSWAWLTAIVFTDEPARARAPGVVVAILAASCAAAALSILVPRHMRRAMVRATRLESTDQRRPATPEGPYRRPPPARRALRDDNDLRSAAVAVATCGLDRGVALALSVSAGGLAMRAVDGHPTLVLALFVASWALMALQAPDDQRAARALREHLGIPTRPADERARHWAFADYIAGPVLATVVFSALLGLPR
jgi:hypothetical protein